MYASIDQQRRNLDIITARPSSSSDSRDGKTSAPRDTWIPLTRTCSTTHLSMYIVNTTYNCIGIHTSLRTSHLIQRLSVLYSVILDRRVRTPVAMTKSISNAVEHSRMPPASANNSCANFHSLSNPHTSTCIHSIPLCACSGYFEFHSQIYHEIYAPLQLCLASIQWQCPPSYPPNSDMPPELDSQPFVLSKNLTI